MLVLLTCAMILGMIDVASLVSEMSVGPRVMLSGAPQDGVRARGYVEVSTAAVVVLVRLCVEVALLNGKGEPLAVLQSEVQGALAVTMGNVRLRDSGTETF